MAETEENQVTLDTIHINNLDWNIDEARLSEIFAEFGEVVSSKIPKRHNKGGSKGFGFVTFTSEESARQAISRMNNVPVDGRRIGVVFATSAEKKPKAAVAAAEKKVETQKKQAAAVANADDEPEPCARLHVRQLDWNVKTEDLKQAFSEYGEVISCRVITNKRTRRSKGYGFVAYGSVEEATQAKEAMNNYSLMDRPIKVFYSKSSGPKESQQAEPKPAPEPAARAGKSKKKGKNKRKKKGKPAKAADEPAPAEEPEEQKAKPKKKTKAKKRLYVKCPPEFGEEKIRSIFEPHGEVKKVNISMNEDQQPKGVVFVSFVDSDSASKALEVNGQTVDGHLMEVSWAQNFRTRRRGGPVQRRA